MVAIGVDGVLEALSRQFIVLHHQLADTDLIDESRVPRRASQRGLVVDGIDRVLLGAQFVATGLQFSGRGLRRRRLDSMKRRRANFQLF